MYKYEQLIQQSPVKVNDTAELPNNVKGLYVETEKGSVILINRNVQEWIEKICILAEEIGHFYTSAGNILNQRDLINRKQEKIARSWAYKNLIPLQKIVQAHQAGIQNRYELAEFLNVTEEFLEAALKRYQEKYGLSTTVEGYVITFDPLNVIKE